MSRQGENNFWRIVKSSSVSEEPMLVTRYPSKAFYLGVSRKELLAQMRDIGGPTVQNVNSDDALGGNQRTVAFIDLLSKALQLEEMQ